MAAPDVLLAILTQMKTVYPKSVFIESLHSHYCNRGGLSKKQLEGLLDKMRKTAGIAPGKIATVEAIILKKPTREKSKVSITAAAPLKDEALGDMLAAILEKYPGHKRVLFIKSRYDKNEAIATAETEEVKKFYKLLIK